MKKRILRWLGLDIFERRLIMLERRMQICKVCGLHKSEHGHGDERHVFTPHS